jgi:hypothetical protein
VVLVYRNADEEVNDAAILVGFVVVVVGGVLNATALGH